ncbi:unnamed protein product [Parnassius apollo]|uniref:(apollo) hypothetical protein n=1 Tax=Parnassius apollo TaxID=110799 RepID=A0A8S3XBP1_PARAO|nr:unnamed protein product [Parnassius apollo]
MAYHNSEQGNGSPGTGSLPPAFPKLPVPRMAIQSPQPQVDDRPISPTPGTSAGSELSQPMMLEVQLDEDVLVLLGDAPKTETPMGPAIYKNIANRWQDILEKGVKESLLKNYLIPSNYDLLMSPALNSGIKAADRDHYKTRLVTFVQTKAARRHHCSPSCCCQYDHFGRNWQTKNFKTFKRRLSHFLRLSFYGIKNT